MFLFNCFEYTILDKFSTLFLFGGWLVTCSWFVGYVDIISVVLMVLISKNCIENNIGFINTGMYFYYYQSTITLYLWLFQ